MEGEGYCNRADEVVAKLDELLAVLNKIDINTDELELNAENINLNTDELEAKVQSVRDQIDVLLSTRASEETLQFLLNALGEEDGTNLLTEVKNILDKVDVNLSTLATEATLLGVKNNLDTVETKLQSIINRLDVDLSTRASEATLASVNTKIGEVQDSPTSYTVLGRLKDLWDKLVYLFETGFAKVKIWDGTNQANVTDENRLKTSTTIIDEHNKEAQFSAFGLLKVAQESMVDDYRFTDIATTNLLFDTIKTGLGDWSLFQTGLQINTGASSASSCQLLSKQIHKYQSGRGQLIKISAILGDSGVDGNIREWGYGDDDNGYFFRMNGTTLQIVIKTRGVETIINSSAWDIPIVPDGFGHLYYIQFEWLGVGNVYFYYDEKIVHTYNFLGTSTNFSIATPDLPVKFKNENTTNTSDVYLRVGCASVVMEGGIVISGRDASGILRQVQVDSVGRMLVYIPPTTEKNNTVQLVWDKNHTAANNYEWQQLLSYTVPTGYDLSAVSFTGESSVANEAARVINRKVHGTFDCSLDSYTDNANTWELPRFGTRIYIYVTSAIGSGINDVITITYTNNDGVTGRTGTVTIPKSSKVGTRLEVLLQNDDYGILNITNVTHSATGQAGAFQISSIMELFYLKLKEFNLQYQTTAISLGGVVVEEGETIYLQYKADSAVNSYRRLSFVGTLIEKDV